MFFINNYCKRVGISEINSSFSLQYIGVQIKGGGVQMVIVREREQVSIGPVYSPINWSIIKIEGGGCTNSHRAICTPPTPLVLLTKYPRVRVQVRIGPLLVSYVL